MSDDQAKSTSHAIDHETVNRLVREVIRRLNDIKPHEAIKFGEKVITASMIAQIPETQKRLSVAADAIITPAARDEVRRRKISIGQDTITEKQAQTANKTDDATPGISDATKPERAASLMAQLQRRGVKLPTTRIIMSETPGRDVYEQCTKYGWRSVMITSLADVDRFNAELSPNSWVLDMTRLNLVAATNVAARIAQIEL